MNPAMYIFANRGLGMTSGKLAAQVAHAAVEAYRISGQDILESWYYGGHYTKLVMLAKNERHLETIATYLNERGFHTKIIIDEGLTEIEPLSKTALGVQVVDRDDPHVQATFEAFQTYRDTVKVAVELER